MATYTLSASGDDSSAGSLSIGKAPTNSTVTTTTANPLPIGRHSSTSDCYSAAFRFTGITETSITAATFSLVADVTYNAGANPIVYIVSCQAADNAGALTTTSGDINATTRPRTTADSGDWVVTSVTGGTRYSIDITSAVQEVMARGGWASGNAIVVLVDTSSSSTVNNEWQDWRAVDAGTSGDEAQLVLTSGTPATTEQEGFRFRNDDGSETTATWLANQDTNLTQPVSTNTRLRMLLNTTADVASTAWRLDYKKSSEGTYRQVLAAQPTPTLRGVTATQVVTNTSGATIQPALPSGTASGDLLVLVVAGRTAGQTVTSSVSGSGTWTRQTGQGIELGTGNTDLYIEVFTRVAGSSEAAPTVTPDADYLPGGTTGGVSAQIAGFYNVTETLNVSAAINSSAAAATWTPPSVSPVTNNTLVVTCVATADDNALNFNTANSFSLALSGASYDTTTGSDHAVGVGYRVVPTGAVTMPIWNESAVGNDAWVGITLAFTPQLEPILLATSSNISASAATSTTAQLTAPSGKTTSDFVAGRISDDTNPMPAIDVTTDDYTEHEWCLSAQSGIASVSDIYQFRVTVAGTAINTYTVTPEWTIGAASQTVSPSGIASAEAFGTATITTGAVTVSPSGIASAEAFGTAVVSSGGSVVSPSGIASEEAFGTATITTGAVTVSPSGIASAEAFGTATITQGAATISPSSIASAEAFGFPTISGPTVNYNIAFGRGYTDVSAKQLVRTSGDRLYAVVMECDAYPYQSGDRLIVKRASSTGIPSGYTEVSVGDHTDVNTVAIAIDGSDKIHVLMPDRSGNLKYRVWLTSTDAWEAAAATIDTGLETNTGQGDQQAAIAVDSNGIPHIIYIKSDGTRRRAYYRNRVGGSWSAAELVDDQSFGTNERIWTPNIAFDDNGRRIFLWVRGTFNDTADGELFIKTRETNDTWNTTVMISSANALLTGIDQSSSFVQTPNGRYHVTWMNGSTTPANKYIRYAYSDDDGATWTRNDPGGGTQATHNPSLGYNAGKLRIYGHGTPDSGNHGANLYYFESTDNGGTWGSWTLFVTGTNYDSSVATRWSQYFNNYPATIDVGYWNDNYPNDLYVGTELLNGSLTITPTALSATGSVVDPTVRLASITVAPTANTGTGTVADPAVRLGGLTLAPAVNTGTGSTIDPTVRLGSLTVAPAALSATGSVVDPAVRQASQTVAPAALSATGSVVDPTVRLGSLTITPSANTGTSTVVDPTVRLGSLTVAPAALTGTGSSVDPSIAGSGLTLTPAANTGTGAVVDPTIILGSLTIIPAVNTGTGSTVDPSVRLGSLTVTPGAETGTGTTVNPSVLGSGLAITPGAETGTGSVVDPSVRLGSITLTPAANTGTGAVVDPTIILGSLTIIPEVNTGTGAVVDPSVVLTGGGTTLTPAELTGTGAAVDPTVILSSLTLAPSQQLATGSSIDPTVRLGSLTLAPTEQLATGSTLDPSVVQSGLVLTPAANSGTAAVVDPSIILGSLTIIPAAQTLTGTSADPSIEGSGLNVSPAALAATGTIIDPSIRLGSLTIVPSVSEVAATAADPAVIQASQAIGPGALSGAASAIDPAIILGSITVPPAALLATGTTIDPALLFSSVSVVPAALLGTLSTNGPVISSGGVTVEPDLLDLTGSMVNPSVLLGALTVIPAALTLTATAPNPTVGMSSQTVAVGSLTATGGITDPTIEVGSVLTPTAQLTYSPVESLRFSPEETLTHVVPPESLVYRP